MVLAALSLEACVYLNPGDGAFVQPDALDFVPSSFAPAFTTNIEAGDIDLDGDLDIVIGYRSDFENQYGISVRRNNGDGTFTPAELYSHFTYPVFVRLRDLDGDGDLDLIWNESDGRFRMRYNDGTGSFGPFINSTIASGQFFDLYDVDNDNDSDVIVAAGFDVAVLRNTGAGTFTAPLYTDIGGFFNVLGMGDFDADGNLDLLTDSAAQGYPQISFGDGSGAFGPTFTVSTGRDVHSFAVGHLDGDANLDFAAIYNLDEKGVSIRRGHGDGNFFVPNHYHGSFQWDDYTTGGRTALIDGDGDGVLDLLFANVKAQDCSFWKGHGDGTFDEVRRFGVGHEAHDLYAADFTGDGVIDVAIATQIDDGAWFHAGVILIEGVAPVTAMPGDVNGDGVVNVTDLLVVLGDWGSCPECPADLDGDGIVSVTDLLLVLVNWS